MSLPILVNEMTEIFATIANFSPDVIGTIGSWVVIVIVVVRRWVTERLALEDSGACVIAV